MRLRRIATWSNVVTTARSRQGKMQGRRMRSRRREGSGMSPRGNTPTVRLRRLAAELRKLRAAADLTRDEVTERTGINGATLYRLETARARPQARTLRALLDLYDVD